MGLFIPRAVFSFVGNIFIAIIFAMLVGLILGAITEKVIIKPVYGNLVQQILITLGLMLVLTEMLKVFLGPNLDSSGTAKIYPGSWLIGDVLIIKFRVLVIVIGCTNVYCCSIDLLKKTKLGLLFEQGL